MSVMSLALQESAFANASMTYRQTSVSGSDLDGLAIFSFWQMSNDSFCAAIAAAAAAACEAATDTQLTGGGNGGCVATTLVSIATVAAGAAATGTQLPTLSEGDGDDGGGGNGGCLATT